MNIKGKISISLANIGSKSEGRIATLTTADNNNYTLYREGALPQNDPFFAPFDNTDVEVLGTIDEQDMYICVSSIILGDGTETIAGPVELPTASSPMFIDSPIATEKEEKPVTQENTPKKRLPRKLKKRLKKQLRNK